MRNFIFHFFILLFNISSFLSQQEAIIWKKAQKLTSQLSIEQKIAQTCQITLDALLKTDANGQVIKPIQIDPLKCEN